jgi:hypothetical protein
MSISPQSPTLKVIAGLPNQDKTAPDHAPFGKLRVKHTWFINRRESDPVAGTVGNTLPHLFVHLVSVFFYGKDLTALRAV